MMATINIPRTAESAQLYKKMIDAQYDYYKSIEPSITEQYNKSLEGMVKKPDASLLFQKKEQKSAIDHKIYKRFSLLLHPDKNKAEDANDIFTKFQQIIETKDTYFLKKLEEHMSHVDNLNELIRHYDFTLQDKLKFIQGIQVVCSGIYMYEYVTQADYDKKIGKNKKKCDVLQQIYNEIKLDRNNIFVISGQVPLCTCDIAEQLCTRLYIYYTYYTKYKKNVKYIYCSDSLEKYYFDITSKSHADKEQFEIILQDLSNYIRNNDVSYRVLESNYRLSILEHDLVKWDKLWLQVAFN